MVTDKRNRSGISSELPPRDVRNSLQNPPGGSPKPALLVSACLLGVRCNHEGQAARRTIREALEERWTVVPVCPEVLGGLSTPRPAAEIQGADGGAVLGGTATVVNVRGDDVTAEYRRGAEAALRLAASTGARHAVLKARSPSCGSDGIYDGSFSKQLTDGEGVTAAALRAAGVEVTSDEDPLPDPGTLGADPGA